MSDAENAEGSNKYAEWYKATGTLDPPGHEAGAREVLSPASRYEKRIACARARGEVPDYEAQLDETKWPLEMMFLRKDPFGADLTPEQRDAEQQLKVEQNERLHQERLEKERKRESHGYLILNNNCFSNTLRGHSFMFDLDKYDIRKKRGFRSDLPRLEHQGATYAGPELMRKIMLASGSATAADLSEEELRKLMVNDHRNCTHDEDVPDSADEDSPFRNMGDCVIA